MADQELLARHRDLVARLERAESTVTQLRKALQEIERLRNNAGIGAARDIAQAALTQTPDDA